MISAGDLRHPVEIERRETLYDATKEPTDTWKAVVPLAWAEITPLHGLELIRAQRLEPLATHSVMMRHDPAVTADHRILFDGRYLEIERVLNEMELGETMTLLCKELT